MAASSKRQPAEIARVAALLIVRLAAGERLLSQADFEPFLLYVEAEHQAEFATWRLANDTLALAIFSDREAAERYRAAAEMGSEWRVYQPAAAVLRTIFESCAAHGIEHAVLNPDHEQALRIWKLEAVLQAAAQSGGEAATGDETH